MNNDDFSKILDDDAGVSPDTATLQKIVGRRDRMVRQWIGSAAVLALVVGGAGGYAISTSDGKAVPTSRINIAAGPSTTTIPPSGVSGAVAPNVESSKAGTSDASGVAVYPYGELQKVFSRVAGKTTVRGFEQRSNYSQGSCGNYRQLQAEVSDDDKVATVVGSSTQTPSNGAIALVTQQTIGTAEGSPTRVLIVSVGSGVDNVKYTSGGSSDEMAPVDGWVVLVAAGKDGSQAGTIEAFNDGKVVNTPSRATVPSTTPYSECNRVYPAEGAADAGGAPLTTVPASPTPQAK